MSRKTTPPSIPLPKNWTARVFLVTGPTIASWTRRLDEEGLDALVQMPSPVNKFPEMVTSVVQRLKAQSEAGADIPAGSRT